MLWQAKARPRPFFFFSCSSRVLPARRACAQFSTGLCMKMRSADVLIGMVALSPVLHSSSQNAMPCAVLDSLTWRAADAQARANRIMMSSRHRNGMQARQV